MFYLSNRRRRGQQLSSFDILQLNYSGKNKDISSEDNIPTGVSFNNDMTKMWVVGTQNSNVHQYTLSTAGDVSTASYDSKSFDVSTQAPTPRGLQFNDDTSKMWVVDNTNDAVYQYTLGTPGDVSTASYDSKTLDVSGQAANPRGLVFNSLYNTLYIIDISSDVIYQYTLGTAEDISTGSYANLSLDISNELTNGSGIQVNSDCSVMWATGTTVDSIVQYNLASKGDISTGYYSGKSLDVSSEDNAPTGFYVDVNNKKLWIVGVANDTVYQYE